MSQQVLRDFLQRVVDDSKNKSEASQKRAIVSEINSAVSEWESAVKNIKVVKLEETGSNQSVWALLSKEATSLAKLQTALVSGKKLKLTKAQELLISKAIKAALPSDIDSVISRELDEGFKREPGSFSVKVTGIPPLQLLDLSLVTSNIKRQASNIPGILSNKFDYGIKMCLKNRLEAVLIDSISTTIRQQNELLINKISSTANQIPPSATLARSLKLSTEALSSNVVSTEEAIRGLVSSKYTISEKEIRDSYKAFIHVFDLGLFFKKLEKDLSDLEVTIADVTNDTSLAIIKSIFGEVASTSKPNFKSPEWAQGTGYAIWVPFKYSKDVQTELSRVLLSSYHSNKKDFILSNVDSDYLDKILQPYNNSELKASSRKPMEETTKLASDIGKKIASEAFTIYQKLLKEEKSSAIVNNPNLATNTQQLGKVSVPVDNVPLICKLVVYSTNSLGAKVDDADSIRRFFNSTHNSAEFSRNFGSKVFQSGHINPVIGWSSWMYGFRHYLHNSLSRIQEGQTLKDFYKKEAEYFEAIASHLDNSSNSKRIQNSLLGAKTGLNLKSTLSGLLLDRLHGEVVASNITFFRSMSQGGNLEASIKVFLERRNVSVVKPAEFEDLMVSVAAANYGMGVVTHPELARANVTFGVKISTLHSKYQDLLLQQIISDIESNLGGRSKESISTLRGSKSISDIIQSTIFKLMQVGKSESVKLTSKAKHTTKGSSTLKAVNRTFKVKSSIQTKVVSTAKPIINIKAKVSTKTGVKAKKPTKVLGSAPRVTNNKPKEVGSLLVTRPRLRDVSGRFTSITNIRNLLDQRLSDVVKSKMGKNGALVNRTGRFAESAEVTEVNQIGSDIDIRYTYMKNPYQTFEPGFAQGSKQRDPRVIIGASIREIAATLVKQRLRITRV